MQLWSAKHPKGFPDRLTWLELLQKGVKGHFQRGRTGQTSPQGDAAGYHRLETWERAS